MRIYQHLTVPISGAYIPDSYWLDPSFYSSFAFGLNCDCNGTLYVYQSSTGRDEEIDSTLTFTIKRNVREVHVLKITSPFVRFKFVYTDTCQVFRFDVFKGDYSQITAPNNLVIQQDADAVLVRPTDYHYEVSLGKRVNETTWNKFGYNADVDIGTEVVAAFGGTFTYLTSASTLTIVSSSTNDTDGGSGAHGLVIYGVDADRNSQTEVVLLTGTTPVVTTTTWLGINRAALFRSGSGQVNAGNITITATTGGTTQAYIPLGEGTTQQLIFFTQAGHTVLADWMLLNAEKISGGGSPKVTFKGWVFSAVSNSKYEVFRQVVDTSTDDHIELRPSQPFIIGEKSIFWIEATTDQNNTVTSGRFSLLEIKIV